MGEELFEKLMVKKRSGKLQKFDKRKLLNGMIKAGAKREIAEEVTRIVLKDIQERIKKPVIDYKKLGNLVIAELRKYDALAAKNFEQFFRKKK